MGEAFLHGNGGSNLLNFKVVGGTSAPSNPKENTIWVNTDEKITGYYFQSEQSEEMTEGEVWIYVGTSSQVAFNALKKNSIMVYPLSVKQKTGGVLVSRSAKSYQGGKWVDWWMGELYVDGKLHNVLAGGFDKLNTTTVATYKENYIQYYDPGSGGGLVSPEKINTSGYTSVQMKGRVSFNTGAAAAYTAALATAKNGTGVVSSVQIPISTSGAKSFSINVPADGGEYYLVLRCGGSGSAPNCVEINEIRMVRGA